MNRLPKSPATSTPQTANNQKMKAKRAIQRSMMASPKPSKSPVKKSAKSFTPGMGSQPTANTSPLAPPVSNTGALKTPTTSSVPNLSNSGITPRKQAKQMAQVGHKSAGDRDWQSNIVEKLSKGSKDLFKEEQRGTSGAALKSKGLSRRGTSSRKQQSSQFAQNTKKYSYGPSMIPGLGKNQEPTES